MNEHIPVELDCATVKDVWGNDQRPFKVESIEFVEKAERLHCAVRRTRNLDLGSIHRFGGATRFEVEIENVSEKAKSREIESAGGAPLT